jgi:hypothetical protein
VSDLLGYRREIREYILRFEQEDLDQTPVISFAETPAADPNYVGHIGSMSLGGDRKNYEAAKI